MTASDLNNKLHSGLFKRTIFPDIFFNFPKFLEIFPDFFSREIFKEISEMYSPKIGVDSLAICTHSQINEYQGTAPCNWNFFRLMELAYVQFIHSSFNVRQRTVFVLRYMNWTYVSSISMKKFPMQWAIIGKFKKFWDIEFRRIYAWLAVWSYSSAWGTFTLPKSLCVDFTQWTRFCVVIFSGNEIVRSELGPILKGFLENWENVRKFEKMSRNFLWQFFFI